MNREAAHELRDVAAGSFSLGLRSVFLFGGVVVYLDIENRLRGQDIRGINTRTQTEIVVGIKNFVGYFSARCRHLLYHPDDGVVVLVLVASRHRQSASGLANSLMPGDYEYERRLVLPRAKTIRPSDKRGTCRRQLGTFCRLCFGQRTP